MTLLCLAATAHYYLIYDIFIIAIIINLVMNDNTINQLYNEGKIKTASY